MAAWGFWNGQFSPHSFAAKAKQRGYAWAALELDDTTTGAFNRSIWPYFRSELEAVGIIPGAWFTEGGNIESTPPDAHFAIAEMEGQADYDGVISAINRGRLPDCSLAIITNFNVPFTSPGAIHPEVAVPLIENGFHCLTECYLGDNPNATPDRLDWTSKRFGWPASQPVFGLWNAPLSTYDAWKDWPGVHYLAENIL